MEKTYKKIEFGLGKTLAECVLELVGYAAKGEFVSGDFNGCTLYSDTVSMDSASLEIAGKTYYDKLNDEELFMQRLLKETEDHRKRIPELTKMWIAKGHKVLSEDKWKEWDICVPIRLSDLYEGMELGMCLDIVTVIKDNSIESGIEIMKSQGHSGMSWGLMKSMVKTFSDRGEEFIAVLDGEN